MNIKKLTEIFTDVFYLEDTSIIPLLASVIVGTRIKELDPLWLMIIGGSSSGKSELINMTTDIKFVHPVSTMTENTLLSGLKTKQGETSLLHQIGSNGTIVMKDFTSIISEREDKRKIILAQLREVYDGRLDKKTGGKVIKPWEGKINLIGGVTEAIFMSSGESSSMGERSVNYILPDVDDRLLLEAQARNLNTINTKRESIKHAFTEFIEPILMSLPAVADMPVIDADVSKTIDDLSIVTASGMSGVYKNYKEEIVFVPSRTKPMRVNSQLRQIIQLLYIIEGEFQPYMLKLISKIAFDTIPKQRRVILEHACQYDYVHVSAVARELGYPSPTVKRWMEEVAALGLMYRKNEIDGIKTKADNWFIDEDTRDLLIKLRGFKRKVGPLIGGDEEDSFGMFSGYDADPSEVDEHERNAFAAEAQLWDEE